MSQRTDHTPIARGLRLLVLPSLLALSQGCSSADDLGAGSDPEAQDDGYGSATAAGTSGAGGSDSENPTTDPSGGGDSDTSSPGGTGGSDEPDSGDPPDDGPPDDDELAGSSSTGEPMECDDQAPVELFLSPDDSNSMSSPVQVRNAVLEGWGSIHSTPIRPWEFLNYYSFAYPAAPAGELALHTTLVPDAEAEDTFRMQIAISSPELDNDDRASMNITLVLDESGSMSGAPMDMQKEACRVIASSLREGDVVSMVGWDTENATKLGAHVVSGPDDAVLLQAIESLAAGGGTDLHGGLVAGYALASESYDATRINRIVLVSDGGANAGVTDEELIAEHAGSSDQDGIYMVGVGVGDGGYNDALMDHVTDIGKGASVFINSPAEAQLIFGDRFLSTMAVAARDVQVRLDMPPGFEIVKFSGEEFSADPTEIEPQHLAPNDAMVFHQTVETCAPDLAGDDAEITVTAQYKDGVTFEQHEVTQTLSFAELQDTQTALLAKGEAVFGYADGLKRYRDDGDAAALDEALAAVARAEEVLPGDDDLAEIRSVLEALLE